ncbi:MAG: TM2 domain-containing protein [Bacteroidetes bacterium]|nr:TM2 domain-containing protein [Bacteroidota bacterium]
MEKSKVEMFLLMNASCFRTADLVIIKERLEKMEDSQFYLLQSVQFQKPDFILVISILLGWERFWLNDIGLGILKVVTCYGCLVWWLIDIISAKDRTYKHNMNEFNKAMMFAS